MSDWNILSFVGDAASVMGLPTSSIGVTLEQKGGVIVVADVIKDGPAYRSGNVRKGDEIAEVGDEPMEGCSLGWIRAKLEGPKGSEVKIKLRRSGLFGMEDITCTIVRDDDVPSTGADAQKDSETPNSAKEKAEQWRTAQQSGGSGWDVFSSFRSALSGQPATVTAGVGINLVKKGNSLIVNLAANGSAEKNGKIAQGDELVSIDGVAIDGESVEQVQERLTGPQGSEVSLELRRAGFFVSDKIEAVLQRDDAPQPEKAANPNQPPVSNCSESGIPKVNNSGFERRAPQSPWSVLNLFDCAGCSGITNGSGIGVRLQQKGDMVVVREVLRGAPAQRSGKVQVDDVILEVDGESAAPTPDGVTRQLGGSRGSEITLKLNRPRMLGFETRSVSLLREDIFVT